MNYSLRNLLIVVTLFVITLVANKHLDVTENGLILLAIFWTSVGFAFGWSARMGSESPSSSILPCMAFLAVIGSCWNFNRVSLNLVDASDQEMTILMNQLQDLRELRAFDAFAVVASASIVLAASRRDNQRVWFLGGVSTLAWFMIAWAGYYHASICTVGFPD